MVPEARRDAHRTRREILTEATAEFASRGFGSTRVDDIAARTSTTKRMIYYYFGSKEGLFTAVLEDVLSASGFDPPDDADDAGDPVASIRWLVASTFDRDEQFPQRARLLAIANIHDARHLVAIGQLCKPHLARLTWLRGVLARGAEQGVFRTQVDPLELLLVVAAVSHFRVTHQPSFHAMFGIDLLEPATRTRRHDLLADMIVAYLTP